MKIRPQTFNVDCTVEELNIIHKALSELYYISKANKEQYIKNYHIRVKNLIEETKRYW